MIAGHFGLAAAVKARAPQVPLWALMVATVWMDIVFVPLFVAGVEPIEPVPGAPAYGGGVIHADYTHSLVGALAIAALFGLVAAIPWGRRVGAVLGAVVFSHWLLDLPMHRADMPLLPGHAAEQLHVGFGLWRLPAASALLELAIVVAGALLYWRAAQRVATEAGQGERRARITSAALLAAGIVTLVLNVIGM